MMAKKIAKKVILVSFLLHTVCWCQV